MKTALPLHQRFIRLIILAPFFTALILLLPHGNVFADANLPTITNTPEPTNTPVPDTPTQAPPSETPYPNPPDDQNNIFFATAIPPTPPDVGGLSTIKRILLACLAVVTVIVIGIIVFLLYNQTRGEGLDNRL